MAGVYKIHRFKDGKVIAEDRIAYANGEYVLLSDYDKIVDELECEKSHITQLKHDLDEIKYYYGEYKKQAQDMIVKLKSELEEWKDEARAAKKSREEILANFRKGIEPYVDLQDMHDKIAELESQNEEMESALSKATDKCDYVAHGREWLENRHQQDCITINQLQTTIDVLISRYTKLRELNNL